MSDAFQSSIPPRIRDIAGSRSSIRLLSGADIFHCLRNENFIIMGCNPRISHVIPGIMKAAQELDAVVAFELSKTEGGVDGGYTGQPPATFVSTVLEAAEKYRFNKPFIIHADHVTIRNSDEAEVEAARALLQEQLRVGYTSFALDASFNSLHDNIDIVASLAATVMEEGYGLEVELGEARGDDPGLTTVEETAEYLDGLASYGIKPHLLSINNGSKRGNYLEGEIVKIDLELTRQIHEAASDRGVCGLVQHGITGTPLRIVGKLADYGIRKGNVGTLWQNVAHACLPLDLMDEMRKWARDNKRDIKYATGVFKQDIDTIPDENIRLIHEMAYREAKEFIKAFRAVGSATLLGSRLEQRTCE